MFNPKKLIKYWMLACPFIVFVALAGTPIQHSSGTLAHKTEAAMFLNPLSSKIWLLNFVQRNFSDSALKDTFKLTLSGYSIFDGKVNFQIVSHNHQVIYAEEFPASDLYGDMNEENSSAPQKLEMIKSNFKHFFDESAFSSPAIARNVPVDSTYFDLGVVRDIKADAKAIGFTYAHSYEGVYEIVWLRFQNKVATCFSSD